MFFQRALFFLKKPSLFFKKLYLCFKDSLNDTIMHDGVEHAGYLAYMFIFSFIPFLVFFVAALSFLGSEYIALWLVDFISNNADDNDNLPNIVKVTLSDFIDLVVSRPPSNIMTLSVLGSLWTTSSTVAALRTIMNRAYRVRKQKHFLMSRLFSIMHFFIIMAVFILVSFFSVFISTFTNKLINYEMLAPIQETLETSLLFSYLSSYLSSGLIIFFTMCLIYYLIPDTKQRFSTVAPGALIASILWNIAVYALSYYLNNVNQLNMLYGSLGGIIATLLFFYILAMIQIYGAEFNYAYQKHFLRKSK